MVQPNILSVNLFNNNKMSKNETKNYHICDISVRRQEKYGAAFQNIVLKEKAEDQLNMIKAVYTFFFYCFPKKMTFSCSICDICQIFSDRLPLKSFATNGSQLKHNQMTIK